MKPRSRIPETHWLRTTPIAHRGLWDETVPENSLTSYRRAIEAGFPIEIDVHLTTDGKIVVAHDDDFSRLCGVQKPVRECSSQEIRTFRLLGTEEPVPFLDETLALVDGKVPLLIEIKDHPDPGPLEEALVRMLRNYRGAFAIQSFNPFLLKRIKRLAPEFLRGLLATWYYPAMPKWKQAFLHSLRSRIFCQPDFISYDIVHLPNRFVRPKRTPLLCWTVRDVATQRKAKSVGGNIIFENFLPE